MKKRLFLIILIIISVILSGILPINAEEDMYSQILNQLITSDPGSAYLIYNDESSKTILYYQSSLKLFKDRKISKIPSDYSAFDFTKGNSPDEEDVTLSPSKTIVFFKDSKKSSYLFNLSSKKLIKFNKPDALPLWYPDGENCFLQIERFTQSSMTDPGSNEKCGLFIQKNGTFKELISNNYLVKLRYYKKEDAHFLVVKDYFEELPPRPSELIYNIKTTKTSYITYVPDGVTSVFHNNVKFQNFTKALYAYKNLLVAAHNLQDNYAVYNLTNGKITDIEAAPVAYYDKYIFYFKDNASWCQPLYKLDLTTMKSTVALKQSVGSSYVVVNNNYYFKMPDNPDESNSQNYKTYRFDLKTGKLYKNVQFPRPTLDIYPLKGGSRLCMLNTMLEDRLMYFDSPWLEDSKAQSLLPKDMLLYTANNLTLLNDCLYINGGDFPGMYNSNTLRKISYNGKSTVIYKLKNSNERILSTMVYNNRIYFNVSDSNYYDICLMSCDLNGKNVKKYQ